MLIERFTCLVLLLICVPAIAAPARGELSWPDLCARLGAQGQREPHEVRRYRMFLNDEPAGHEVFRFWRDGDRIRVVVTTELEGDVLVFPADFRHCRDESWADRAGQLELIELEAETRYAVPFKPDYAIRIERDPKDDAVIYRTASSLGASDQRHPANTGPISPWSIRTLEYDRVVNVFEDAVYRIESRLVERATVDGREIAHHAIIGEWPRHLWYSEGKMIRFCAVETFSTYIETVLEPYADRDIDAVGLNRTCAELFDEGEKP